MASTVEVRLNPAQVRRLERDLAGIRNGIPRVRATAIRRTVPQIRSRIVKSVAADMKIKQQELYSTKSSRRPIKQRFIFEGRDVVGGEVKVLGEPWRAGDQTVVRGAKASLGRLPLRAFGAKQLKRGGVSYRIGTRPRKRIKEAFVATMKSGHVGVFVRRKGSSRKIVELFGPSVPHVALNQREVQDLLRRGAADLFEKQLADRVDFLVRRSRARV